MNELSIVAHELANVENKLANVEQEITNIKSSLNNFKRNNLWFTTSSQRQSHQLAWVANGSYGYHNVLFAIDGVGHGYACLVGGKVYLRDDLSCGFIVGPKNFSAAAIRSIQT